MPSAWVASFLEHAECSLLPDSVDDRRLDEWCEDTKREHCHYYPQLLRHVGWNQSTLGHPAESWRKGGECR